ncbi:MAG: hypothetical protein ACYCZA_04325 [Thiobacillus sp.]
MAGDSLAMGRPVFPTKMVYPADRAIAFHGIDQDDPDCAFQQGYQIGTGTIHLFDNKIIAGFDAECDQGIDGQPARSSPAGEPIPKMHTLFIPFQTIK